MALFASYLGFTLYSLMPRQNAESRCNVMNIGRGVEQLAGYRRRAIRLSPAGASNLREETCKDRWLIFFLVHQPAAIACISLDYQVARGDTSYMEPMRPEERSTEQAQNKEAKSLYSGLLCQFLVVEPWANYLTFLSSSILICKMKIFS